MSFTNKVVLVIGASSGIGAATALLFTKEGANVAIVGRNEAKLQAVTSQCEKCGKKPFLIIADISKDDQAVSIINKTIENFGKLDILINNAAIMRLGTILDGTILSSFDELMNTNLRALMNLTMMAAPHLIKSKGNIVNISSVGGLMVAPVKFLSYCISKAALNVFSTGAAAELAPHGVRVNTVSPGPVHTDIWENANLEKFDGGPSHAVLNRESDPEEIAHLILYLAGDKSIGITGSNFVSDNGVLLKQ